MGGLIGAALGSRVPVGALSRPGKPRSEEEIRAEQKNARRAVPLYWLTLLALVLATAIITPLVAEGKDGLLIMLIVVVGSLPALQLAASVLGFLMLLFLPVDFRGAAAEQLASITLKAFLWALLGAPFTIASFYAILKLVD